MGPATFKALNIETVPLLVKTVSEKQSDNSVVAKEARLTNPFSIMLEIARACYLEEVLFSKADAVERNEIGTYIEMVGRLDASELVQHINTQMA